MKHWCAWDFYRNTLHWNTDVHETFTETHCIETLMCMRLLQKHTAVGCTQAYNTLLNCAKETSQKHTKHTTRMENTELHSKEPIELIFTETLYTQMNSNVLH